MIESSRISGTVCVTRELFGVYLKMAPGAGGEVNVLEMSIVLDALGGGINSAFNRLKKAPDLVVDRTQGLKNQDYGQYSHCNLQTCYQSINQSKEP